MPKSRTLHICLIGSLWAFWAIHGMALSELAAEGPANGQTLKDSTPAKTELRFCQDTKTPAIGVRCPDAEQLRQLFKPLQSIQVNVAPSNGALPIDCSAELFLPAECSPEADCGQREWLQTEFTWAASELAHQPLYFDDVPLERYGQTIKPAIQPVLSGVRFFGVLPIMPYKLILDRPFDCVSTLGYYRPGSPTPCTGQKFVPSAGR